MALHIVQICLAILEITKEIHGELTHLAILEVVMALHIAQIRLAILEIIEEIHGVLIHLVILEVVTEQPAVLTRLATCVVTRYPISRSDVKEINIMS